ncbi:M56 family metallopeptidase [Blastopirellula sp. JC732]|uniref:M56 family metallopeptidase n=1 Tax=Blastopirellula sediminis TaxID=2894196 RepID=A0A9X1MLP2_9BACT|nr:M56 family metallopeptidase [Blastopirellula sediminis]MCC9608601.1 M56 family metallopeptidase [Blastopirellula sediminis]MCC9628622.1 M56 family metallopeptidase [Blastopirellula sediminis]
MIESTLLAFFVTYLIHSTAFVLAAWGILHFWASSFRPEIRIFAWKAALVLPFASALVVSTSAFPHFGFRWAIHDAAASVATLSEGGDATAILDRPDLVSLPIENNSFDSAEMSRMDSSAERVDYSAKIGTTKPWIRWQDAVWLLWGTIVCGFFGRLGFQAVRLERLKQRARKLTGSYLNASLGKIQAAMGIQRTVDLYLSTEIDSPITGGVWRSFILLPEDWQRELAFSNSSSHENRYRDAEAILGHELAHVAQGDAIWTLIAHLVVGLIPWQPLNRLVCRQVRKEMEYVADRFAARTLGDGVSLAKCLVSIGERRAIANCKPQNSILATGMATYRSELGLRVEELLTRSHENPSRSSWNRILACLAVGMICLFLIIPKAVSHSSHLDTRTLSMRNQVLTLAVLVGLTSPLAAEEPKSPQAEREAVALQTSPDELPAGIRKFSGMVVGRLAAKDVERGTFVVQVDAIPRVWKNNGAENPKSIVGKTIEVSGVAGKFLDVLVVLRPGETVEFECKHDGERLVFPGELLRKVAPYKVEDYPVLPEEFRGFRGEVVGDVVQKDPETFELIIKVAKVAKTWNENGAKNPESIEGKTLMLAGFWNRREAYHNLKVGDRIQVGMQHIGRQSDHLTVAEGVRKVDSLTSAPDAEMEAPEPKMERTDGQRGFRGLLVGKLTAKDSERGTFSIVVDAVPRVWRNNQARNPKGLIGKTVDASGVHSNLLDTLVVARIGDTLEFGALDNGEGEIRVGEVLRKVAPVEPGDYPELPEAFRGFKGLLKGKVVKKDDKMLDLKIEVTGVVRTFEQNRAKNAESIVGKTVVLSGFWQRKEAFYDLKEGDVIQFGAEHPVMLTDNLTVIEGVKKVD